MAIIYLSIAALTLVYGIGKAILNATKDDGKDGKKLSAGSFEVPLALGASIWFFIIFLINVYCLKPCGPCEKDKCCADGAKCEMQQTAPEGHH